MEQLRRDIESFTPTCEQEIVDCAEMLNLIDAYGSTLLERSCPFHFTTSAWILDPTLRHTVMAYHNIYHSWSWIGGHADGCVNLTQVAAKELAEETGISDASLLPANKESPILSLEILTVNGHQKNGRYVSSHLHLNVTYLFVAKGASEVRIKPDENSAIGWFALNEVESASSEPWIREHIYRKLITKTERLRSTTL